MKINIFSTKRKRTIFFIFLSLFILSLMMLASFFVGEEQLEIQLNNKYHPPGFSHIFGTDWLGRDMFARTIKGLSLSMWVGIIASITSGAIALLLSILSFFSNLIDRFITLLIDVFLSVPHLVILLLISFAAGGGYKGVILGIALTHWPSLTRVLRAEIMQLKSMEYVTISQQMGKSKVYIAKHHMFPHLMSQLFVGCILLFPHAILHEAAITFLGFGLPPEQPAIGIILSESMRYLSIGMWWLAFFPGLCLFFMVSVFDMLGKNLRDYFDPFQSRK